MAATTGKTDPRPLQLYDENAVIPESPVTQPKRHISTAPTTTSQNQAESFALSEKVMQLLETRVPENTKRTNEYSLRAFSRFVTGFEGFADDFFRTEPNLRSHIMHDAERKLRWQLEETRKVFLWEQWILDIYLRATPIGRRIS